jgi:hypothetical protein
VTARSAATQLATTAALLTTTTPPVLFVTIQLLAMEMADVMRRDSARAMEILMVPIVTAASPITMAPAAKLTVPQQVPALEMEHAHQTELAVARCLTMGQLAVLA